MKRIRYFTYLSGLAFLFLAACAPVGSRLVTPTQASSPSPQTTSTQVSSPETQTKTFSSNIYHYKVSYPVNWTIQVSTADPAGAGSNPEYVTFTSNDPSGLPRIDIEVLTDAPPIVGFEKCDQNFVFRNIPACKIFLPAGQRAASEVWVFQNGTAHFFIGMQYQDSEPVQIFADFLMSFEFTAPLATTHQNNQINGG